MLKPAAPPPPIDNPAEAGLRQASGGGGMGAAATRIDDAAEAIVNQEAGGDSVPQRVVFEKARVDGTLSQNFVAGFGIDGFSERYCELKLKSIS